MNEQQRTQKLDRFITQFKSLDANNLQNKNRSLPDHTSPISINNNLIRLIPTNQLQKEASIDEDQQDILIDSSSKYQNTKEEFLESREFNLGHKTILIRAQTMSKPKVIKNFFSSSRSR